MIALGLILAVASSVAINGGYALQHASAVALPPLTLRRPFHSLALLFRSRRWAVGFFAGIGGWVLYVVALAACAALARPGRVGGRHRACSRVGGPRLRHAERVGVVAALAGLLLLGALARFSPSLDARQRGAVIVWMLASAGVAGGRVAAAARRGARHGRRRPLRRRRRRRRRPRSRAARGCSSFPPFSPATGSRSPACSSPSSGAAALATAGLAVLWTNALPIVAGTFLFGEGLPGGVAGAARVAAFALVLVGARRPQPAARFDAAAAGRLHFD